MTPTERLPDPPKSSGWVLRWNRPKSCGDIDHHADRRGLRPGRYKHTCPTCGTSYFFDVVQPDIRLVPVAPPVDSPDTPEEPNRSEPAEGDGLHWFTGHPTRSETEEVNDGD